MRPCASCRTPLSARSVESDEDAATRFLDRPRCLPLLPLNPTLGLLKTTAKLGPPMEYLSSNPLGIDLHLLTSSFLDAVNLTASSPQSASTSLVARRAHHRPSAPPPKASSTLCYNGEGWGPYSSLRDTDLTPCFESSVIVVPALLLVLVGSLIVGLLARQQRRARGGMSERLLGWKLVSH